MARKTELPNWPGMMKRARAAAYFDLSPADFDKAVAAGRIPPPVTFMGQELWHRAQLDETADQAAGVRGSGDWRLKQPLYQD